MTVPPFDGPPAGPGGYPQGPYSPPAGYQPGPYPPPPGTPAGPYPPQYPQQPGQYAQPDQYPQQGQYPPQQQDQYPQQQGQYQQSQYPQAPGYPAGQYPQGYGQFAAAPQVYADPALHRPPSITRAVVAWLIAAVCWTGGMVAIELTYGAAALNALGSANHYGTVAQNVWAAAGVLVLVGAVWVLLIMRMRAGAGWARITLTILGVFGCLYSLAFVVAGFVGGGGPGYVESGMGVVVSVAVVCAIVFMFQGHSSAYYRAVRRSS